MTGITVGTVADPAGNAMISTVLPTGADALASSSISIDNEAPSVVSFSVRDSAGATLSATSVRAGDELTIVAQMSEALEAGSSNTVTIGSVDVSMAVDATDGKTMTGTYIVPDDLAP